MSTRVVQAVLVTPLLLAMLGGCVYRSREVQTSTPSPVVMAPAPPAAPAVVVPPAAPPVNSAVPSDRIVYPEGRWQLYGDGRSVAYYWVWIPTGSTLAASRRRREKRDYVAYRPRTGFQAACLPWLHERQVALLIETRRVGRLAADRITHG